MHLRPAPHLDLQEATHGQMLLPTFLLPREHRDLELSHHRPLQVPSDMRTILDLVRERIHQLRPGQGQQRMMGLRHDERHTKHGQKCEVEKRLPHITPMDISHHLARMREEAPDSKFQNLNHHRFQRETATRLVRLVETNRLPRIPPHIIHSAQVGHRRQSSSHHLRRPRQETRLQIL